MYFSKSLQRSKSAITMRPPSKESTLLLFLLTKNFLDLKNGCYHIAIRPEDRHKTAFSLPWQKLQFIRKAQALLDAPFTFTESIIFLSRVFIEFCGAFSMA